ncbi:hypothetical protein COB55_02470, partial [Candidatus Wolfebacteria bacterium]
SFAIGSSTKTDFIVTNSGNVGIGTTSPPYKLSIAGFINTDQYSGFKQAGVTILHASSTNFSTFVGANAGALNLDTGVRNVAMGYDAAAALTTGDDLTAIGYNALKAVTTAGQSTAVGSYALSVNTSGTNNTALGYTALRLNQSGHNNVALGYNALNTGTGVDDNVAIGSAALDNASGDENVAIGSDALGGASNSASANVAIGHEAGLVVSSGVRLTAIGWKALNAITSANDSTAIGYNALLLDTGGSNTAVGSQALDANTSGVQNTAIGLNALGAISTANNSTAVGHSALALDTSGSNTAVGSSAGAAITSSSQQNVLVGATAGSALSTGSGDNVAIGYAALASGSSDIDFNVAIGTSALGGASFNGDRNIAIGYVAGNIMTSASDNILLGHAAGDNLTSGDNNLIIGNQIDAPSATGSNRLTIGNIIFGINISATGTTVDTDALIGIGTSTPWAQLSVNPNALGGGVPSFVIGSSTATHFVIDGSGKVGIGTTSPASLLSVEGDAYITGSVIFADGSTQSSAGLSGIVQTSGGDGNTAVGSTALDSLTGGSGLRNTAFGSDAGTALTTGDDNVFLGYQAGDASNTQNYNIGIGSAALGGASYAASSNIAIGYQVGDALTSGTGHTAVGHQALSAMISGGSSTAIGYQALTADTGGQNTAVGYTALLTNAGGQQNTAVGYQALNANSGTHGNTAVGYNAMLLNTAGDNTAMGAEAMDANTSGVRNSAFGFASLSAISTTNDSTAFGYNALKLDTGGSNTAVGSYALDANAGGINNVAMGLNALGSVTSGQDNVAIGTNAGDSFDTEGQNIAIGTDALGGGSYAASDNVAIGYQAGLSITSGNSMIAIGTGALSTMTSGSNSIGIGFRALELATGADNIAIGKQAGDAISSGTRNLAIGTQALSAITINNDSTAVGYNALILDTGGSNTALGSYALDANAGGTNNVAIGLDAGGANITGGRNISIGNGANGAATATNDSIAIGHNALLIEASGGVNIAIGTGAMVAANGTERSVAIGHNALLTITTADDSTAVGYNSLLLDTGGLNTAVGSFSGDGITGGKHHTAIGYGALSGSLTASDDNTAVGYLALTSATGARNTAIGGQAGDSITGGANNTAVGQDALQSLVSASNSTAIGYSALSLDTGGSNIALGSQAGDNITSGSSNLIIGYSVDAPSATLSNQLNIGNLLFSKGIDGTGTTLSSGNLGIGTTTPYRKLEVYGTAGSQLRLSTLVSTSTSNFVDLGVTNNGRFSISLQNQPDRFSINSLGNVGIGATALTPSYTLDVSGTFRAADIRSTTGGTFAAKVDYAAATEPVSVSIGDLNNDGYDDLAVANNSSGEVSVYINDGDGTFAAKVDYTPGTTPYFVAIGDLNNDGYADLAVANLTDSDVSIFINNGDGTFASKVDYATGSTPYALSIGDLNNDGYADIAVPNNGSATVSVLINDGDGTFATKVDYGTGTGPISVSIGDLNNDGYSDLAVANNSETDVSVLINDTDGTFATKVDYPTGASPISVSIGDLNNDGYSDLAVANNSDADVSVLINDTDGTFAAKVDYTTGSSPYSVSIGDLNNDGYDDLAVANSGSDTTSVLINDGDGTFATKVDYATGVAPRSVAIGDLNNDGYADLAVANYTDGDVSILLNSPSTFLYAQSSTGRVGIGTTTPTGRLQIASTSPKFYITDTDAGLDEKHWWIGASAGEFSIGTTSDDLATNSTYFTIEKDTGFVGLGTTNPSARLEVFDGEVWIFDEGDSARILIGDNSSSGQYGTLKWSSGSDKLQLLSTGGTGIQIGDGVGAVEIGTGSGDVLLVSGGGKVGINESTPLSLVHMTNDADSLIEIRLDNTNSGTDIDHMALSFYDGGTLGAYMRLNNFSDTLSIGTSISSSEIDFQINDVTQVRIDSSGNVGIGTTTPTDLLQIASTDPKFYITDTNAGTDEKHWWIGASAGEFSIGTTSDDLATDSTYFTIEKDTGYVGIGTNNPSAKLEVFDGEVWIFDEGDSARILLGDNGGSGQYGTLQWNSGNDSLSLDSTGSSDLIMNPGSGFMGVNDSSPLALIHMTNDADSLTELRIDNSNAGTDIDHTALGFYDGGALGAYVRLNNFTDTLSIGTSITSSQIDFQIDEVTKVSIDASGNVGIGTTTPFGKFAVNDSDSLTDFWFSNTAETTDEKHWVWQSGSSVGSSVFRLRAINDTNSAGSNALQFTRSGTTISKVVFPNGNVGIGTTTPASVLQIASTANTEFMLTDTNASADQKHFGIFTDTGKFNIRRLTDAYSGYTPAFTIDSSDNVGIGITTPDQTLHVFKGSAGSITANTLAPLVVENSTHSYINILSPNNVNTGIYFGDEDDNDIGKVEYFHASDVLSFTTNTFERMRIDSSGNVGIGTTTPNATLNVHTADGGVMIPDAAGDDLVIENSAATGLSILSPDGNDGSIYFGTPSDTTGAALRWNHNADTFTIETRNTGASLVFETGDSAEAMRIDSSGNVGIGTITPDKKLDVTFADDTLGAGAIFQNTDGSLELFNTTATLNNFAPVFRGNSLGTGQAGSVFWGNIPTGDDSGTVPVTIFRSTVNAVSSVVTRPMFQWQEGTTPVMTIDSSGNVAIGTSSPEYDLDISKTSAGNLIDLRTANLDTSNTSSGTRIISAVGGSGSGDPRFLLSVIGVQEWYLGIDNSDSDKFQIGKSSVPGAQVVMTLDTSGNVGIGTVNPGDLLHVQSTAPYLRVDITGGKTEGGILGGLRWEFDVTGNIPASITALSDGSSENGAHLGFNTMVAGGSLTEKMRIDSSGNVGIGSTSPTWKLSVAGFINTDQYSGFKQEGQTILYSSTTNQSLLAGAGAGAALLSNGTANTALGYEALNIATSSDGHTAVGYRASYSNAEGSANTALGANALYTNATGNNNTATGYAAMYSNISGGLNTATGYNALYSSTIGTNNAAYGYYALRFNQTGSQNVAQGMLSLLQNTSATSSVGIGYGAGQGTAAYSAGELTLVGTEALYSVATGAEDNTAVGYRAGYGNTSGANNIYLGYQAGDNITTGSNNLIIGYDVDAPSASNSNQLNIGNLIFGTGIDGTGTTISSGNIGIGTTTPWGLLSINPNGISGPSFAIGSSTKTDFIVTNGGDVGIGTESPDSLLHILKDTNAEMFILERPSATSKWGIKLQGDITADFKIADMTTGTVPFTIEKGADNDTLYLDDSGNVGIGTTTPVSTLSIQGSLCVRDTGSCGTTAGTIYATTATISDIDLAENYQTTDDTIVAGEVVSLDPDNAGFIKRASSGDNTPVLGIVSTAPGLLLGSEIANSKPVALTGRVPLIVNTEGGDISIGDRLTLSTTDGVARRATTTSETIGIALSAYSATSTTATSTIEAFIELRKYTPEDQMIIDHRGYIGIGTTTPQYPISLASGAYVTTGGTWTNASSRELKENFTDLDSSEILEKILSLEITQWNYKLDNASTTHIGPIAEDFYDLFALGGTNTSISSIDPAGIALVGIQALNDQIAALDIEGLISQDNSSLFDSFLAYLENLGTRIVAGIVYVTNLVVGTSDNPTGITLYADGTGDPYCLTINSSGEPVSTAGVCGSTSQQNTENNSVDTSAPTLTLNGNNPAIIPLNSTYNDLGANVEDDTSDNLGYKTYLDGVYTTNVSLDTSINATYEIAYNATDQDGNTATTTRSVVVGTGEEVLIAEEEGDVATTTPEVVIEETPTEEPTQEVVAEEVIEEVVTEEIVEEVVVEDTPTEEVVEEVAVEEVSEEVVVEETPTEEPAEEVVVEESLIENDVAEEIAV